MSKSASVIIVITIVIAIIVSVWYFFLRDKNNIPAIDDNVIVDDTVVTPPVQPLLQPSFLITKAEYGNFGTNKTVDVTQILRGKSNSEYLVLLPERAGATNAQLDFIKLFGDPAPGLTKELKIQFRELGLPEIKTLYYLDGTTSIKLGAYPGQGRG